MDIRRLLPTDPDFPNGLRQLSDPPAAIYIRGNIRALLRTPLLAVVGSRKPTAYGRQVTSELTGQLAARGVTIVSGLAFGIDALAHQAALEAGGLTVAVLGTGLDRISPAANDWLGRQILQNGGALISEYPPGSPSYKHNFVARNRLVAGLSDGVLVTEAAASSGSRHTAIFGLDQGKPVMAVPGNITSAMSEGTNNLLKTIAAPVTSVKDIFNVLGIMDTKDEGSRPRADNAEEGVILELIGRGLSNGDELLAQSGLTAAVFNKNLTMLEISGKVQAHGNNHWGIKI